MTLAEHVDRMAVSAIALGCVMIVVGSLVERVVAVVFITSALAWVLWRSRS